MASWTGIALSQLKTNMMLVKQTELNDFLLQITRDIFDDLTGTESLVAKIMAHTKLLVDADRCALFMLTEDKSQLYAEVFDEGKKDDEGNSIFSKSTNSIRFPSDKGIAGHVAQTCEVVNIPDAYSDHRFNRDIDMKTGYTTRNLLTMPIICKNKVLGVVQMVNKKNGTVFTNADEMSFKTFAVYCALALHYSKMYRLTIRQQKVLQVTLEMLSYHAKCGEDDLNKLRRYPHIKEIPEDFQLYSFYCDDYEAQLPQLYIYMVQKLFGPDTFDLSSLCSFILTIKKNYREVAYHNWDHAFTVCHCMFTVLLSMIESEEGCPFDLLEQQAFMVATIAHDIDHRGYNNDFFNKCKEPMAALYSTSTMEMHHFRYTCTVLQQQDNQILGHLSREDYKKILQYIEHAILATDLTFFMPNQKRLSHRLENNSLDLNVWEHRQDVKAILVTVCDMCAVCKNWDVQQNVAKLIYEEFFFQGDEEKKRGLEPIPMMDRARSDQIPKQQVGFINFVSPAYKLIAMIFPCCQPLLDGLRENLDNWQRIACGKEPGMWEVDKSRRKP